MARLNKWLIMPYCYFCLENKQKKKKRCSLKTVALFNDGTGSTGRWSELSAKEKGIPHIIPRTWRVVTWGFPFNSVTVQSSRTVIVFFITQHQTTGSMLQQHGWWQLANSYTIMSFPLTFSLSFFIVSHIAGLCILNLQFRKVVEW